MVLEKQKGRLEHTYGKQTLKKSIVVYSTMYQINGPVKPRVYNSTPLNDTYIEK